MSVLTNWVLKRRAATVLVMLVILLFGTISVTQLKNELLPNIDFPLLTVSTFYPGASANDVEEQVSKPVEQVVGSIPRLKSLRTVSRESFSLIVAEFEYGTDLKSAQQSIDTGLRNITLPNGLNGQRVQPTASQINFNNQPVIYVGLENKQNLTPEQLSDIALNQVKPALTGIDGVANVEIIGNKLRQLRITPKPAALTQRGLSVNDINTALRGFNTSFPAGTVDVAGQTVPVRTAFTFSSIEDLKNLPVAAGAVPGASGTQAATGASAAASALTPAAKLSDIADVAEVDAPSTSISRTNGTEGVLLQVFKTQSGNTVKVSDETIKRIDQLSSQSGGSYTLRVIYDTAGQIRNSIDGLIKEGLLGAFFAVLVIFLFLRNIRSTLVTAISIPTSMVVAFILLWTQGITLNIMTLGGLAVAVGRVVDDSIVVLENIYRRVQLGEPVNIAARKGTREVAGAITSSTITTVAVFLPLGFIGGIAGQFFLPFALTVTFALLASLVVALTIIPVFATFFINRKVVGAHNENESTLIQRTYTPALNWSLRNRWKVLGMAAVLFFASIFLVTKVPLAFLPDSGDRLLQVSINLAAGSTQANIIDAAKKVEDSLGQDPRVELRQTTISGRSGFGQAQRALGASSDAGMLVRIRKDANIQDTARELREKLKPLAPAQGSVNVSVLGGFSSASFSLNVQAQNSEAVQKASSMVLDRLKPIQDQGKFANLRSDVTALNTQVLITPNPNIGGGRVTTQALGFLLASALQPTTATTVRFQNGQAEDVVIYPPYQPGNAADLDAFVNNLKSLPLLANVPLGAIADVKLVQAQTQATRIGQKPAASINADITTEDTGGVTRDVTARLNGIQSDPNWPAGATWTVAGVSQQQSEAFGGLFIALGIAVALVYIVMVIAFGSLLEPFAILFSLPLASIGAFGALFITNRAIGLPAMIGLLMLIGIVVTNAIVLIDRVNQNRERGLGRDEALVEAGRNRVRPILMTAMATILALIPLAAGLSEGSIIAAELGTVVIGGLLTSTFLTLLVVPVVYSLLEGAKVRLGGSHKPVLAGDGLEETLESAPESLATSAADSDLDSNEIRPATGSKKAKS